MGSERAGERGGVGAGGGGGVARAAGMRGAQRGGDEPSYEVAVMLALYEQIARRRRRERSMWRRALPVGLSIAAHIGLLVLTAAVAWRVTHAGSGRETIVSFDDPSFGAPRPPRPELTAVRQPPAAESETSSPASAARPDLRQLAGEGVAEDAAAADEDPLSGVDPFAARPSLLGGGDGAGESVEPVLGDVRFIGVGAANARSVVYVVDASGPMVSSLPMVKERLIASVDRLRPTQRFGVVAFRRIESLGALGVTGPAGGEGTGSGAGETGVEVFSPRLVRATTGAKARLREWLEEIDARGRSAPLDGLRAGLELEPDAVFLLSRGIARSGGGVWGQGLEGTLAELERLNPADRSGRRRAAIKAIQFLDEDPTGIMRAIAARHAGEGADGYTIIRTLEELEESD